MRRRTVLGIAGGVVLLGLILANSTFAASPSLSRILPRGAQRGTEVELTFVGARLQDAQEILFYEPGFEVLELKAEKSNRLKVRLKIDENCSLGEHTMQVRTASGISEYRTFHVGALPTVDEKEPNNDFDSPQPVELNSTVAGVVQNEDVDFFVVEAKKGQRIVAEIEGMRLGVTMFDPYVAILNSQRFELSAADDTPLVYQDGVAAIVAPEDGRYVIEVRESAYGGNGNCHYRLHVGDFPRPTGVYPAGGKYGEQVDLRFLGDVAGELRQTEKLPEQSETSFGIHARDEHGIAPSANPFRLFPHGNAFEQEPNNSRDEATPAELPLAFNGIIGTPGDVDCFRFQAKKGQRFEVNCYARRIRSPLDPVMRLYHPNGKQLSANDDTGGPDSYFRFNVPADGEYVVRISDHLDRGGEDYIYRIEFTPLEPELALSIPRVRRYSQERQTIVVPRGNRFATRLNARRRNFSGELVIEADDLPEGITMVSDPMPSNMSTMPLLFEAAEDAPISGKLIDLKGRHADPSKEIWGRFENTADLVRGRNNQIFWTRDVRRLAVAVVEEVPFRLEIVEPKVPIVRNGSMQLKIIAHRQDGFDKAIRVEFPFRPPGLGAASAATIPADKNEVLYPLNANGKARLGEWKVFVLGSADVGGKVWVSSQLATLKIAEPYLKFTLQRAAVEQGQETQVFCKIEHNHPFQGQAKAQLLGLPQKVTTSEMVFTRDQDKLAFPIQTDKSSPAGRHKNVLCQVVVTENGEPIVHTVGKTELRIDKPLPKPKDEPAKKEVAKKEEKAESKPEEKPLSRLEQLRLEAQQRARKQSEAESTQ